MKLLPHSRKEVLGCASLGYMHAFGCVADVWWAMWLAGWPIGWLSLGESVCHTTYAAHTNHMRLHHLLVSLLLAMSVAASIHIQRSNTSTSVLEAAAALNDAAQVGAARQAVYQVRPMNDTHNRAPEGQAPVEALTSSVSAAPAGAQTQHGPRNVSSFAADASSDSAPTTTMSSFKQAEHKLLMIPGPIEVADDVLLSNAHPSMAHVSPDFIPVFGESIEMLRQVADAPSSQPFIIAGSGTLGWDLAAANLLEKDDDVLVLSTGYFGDSFAECIEAFGGKPKQLSAPAGSRPNLDEFASLLKEKKYKAVTITHVDTSTGILMDVPAVTNVVKSVSPDTLVILDGVCSVGSEEIHMDAWGVDFLLFASQKGIGIPPGLSLSLASPRAIQTFEKRSSPPAGFYTSWKKWLPVMKAYEGRTPAYFATPPTNLIYALHTSLKTMTQGQVSLSQRFQMHRDASKRVKKAIQDMGLEQLALPDSREDGVANGMTAVRYPKGLSAPDILPKMAQRGVVFGPGLHKDCKNEYFRIGHMGISVVDPRRGDIDTILKKLEEVLVEAGHKRT